jgi:molybdate transport system substrate-binding protein
MAHSYNGRALWTGTPRVRPLIVVALAVCVAATASCARRSLPRVVAVRGGPALGSAFTALGDAFEGLNPGARIVASFTCPPCILPPSAGAETDVFVTPGDEDIQRLRSSAGLDLDPVVDCGSAELCVVAPKAIAGSIHALKDLQRDDIRRIGIGNPDQVAVGRSTKRVLENAGLWQSLQPKLRVTQSGCELLKLMGIGRQVDVAFAYRYCEPDTGSSLVIAPVPAAELWPPVPLRIGVSRAARERDTALLFVQFVQSGPGQEILRRYGIGPAKESG